MVVSSYYFPIRTCAAIVDSWWSYRTCLGAAGEACNLVVGEAGSTSLAEDSTALSSDAAASWKVGYFGDFCYNYDCLTWNPVRCPSARSFGLGSKESHWLCSNICSAHHILSFLNYLRQSSWRPLKFITGAWFYQAYSSFYKISFRWACHPFACRNHWRPFAGSFYFS